MIFLFLGFPFLAFSIHNILIIVSFASDPELQKKTFSAKVFWQSFFASLTAARPMASLISGDTLGEGDSSIIFWCLLWIEQSLSDKWHARPLESHHEHAWRHPGSDARPGKSHEDHSNAAAHGRDHWAPAGPAVRGANPETDQKPATEQFGAHRRWRLRWIKAIQISTAITAEHTKNSQKNEGGVTADTDYEADDDSSLVEWKHPRGGGIKKFDSWSSSD